ncbi:rho GTPase-activating protein 18 [Brienomyrus brachyistius]|uniref:rho GTPase-activating protein 18 n=1 Tax=Brienomyrus brachyistius TaxID=42636 RepID=UPI0020B31AF2|nr:rho GTPase-activating protein 18 [Brienomyrus brachyistius]
MSRQQAEHGVVLTGYFSSSEARPAAGVSAADEAESPVPSHKTCQYLQSRAKHARGKSPCSHCGSQDSLDELSLDDYWKEVENIHQSGAGDAEHQEEVQLKVTDEGEREEAWLAEVGLATLIDGSASDPEDTFALLSTLTRTQAAAVEKRVETLKQTLRKKNKQHQIPDVRDIFKPPVAQAAKLEVEVLPARRTENVEGEVGSSGPVGSICENGAGAPGASGAVTPDSEINVEISFSEQALLYREGSKGTEARARSDVDDKLPNFKVSRDRTGMTKVGDLADQDMKKVHRLALIEMTALFDTAGIDLKPQKALKLKVKESGLFGVPLPTLLEQDQKRLPGTKVPLILQRLISHIESEGLATEGLLRIPGVATRVKAVCLELEAKFYDGLFAWETLKQHDAASVLKLFIRELPYPLLSVEYLNAFTSVLKLPTKKQQLQTLNLLVLLLPTSSRSTLKALLEFFRRVMDHKEQNKMTLNNIAVVMAPNIFMFKGFRSKVSEQQEFSMATGMAHIVRLLIRYQDLLWTIPKFIMNQVRKQNMENQKKMSKDRAMKKLLKKMAYDREKSEKLEKNAAEECAQGLIRIQAPQFSKISMAVQLTDELRVADIVARFVKQESALLGKKEDFCLYEVGGNINERCLDEEAYMKNVIELNPSAEWVIKPVPH